MTDYDYPHARGTVPADAARITSGDGASWALSAARAVPTGFYLWELAGRPGTFRTLAQIRSQRGVDDAQARRGTDAENAQYLAQVRR